MKVIKKILGSQIMLPLIALLALVLLNIILEFILEPGFFEIKLGTNNAGLPIFTGNIITILDYGSELAILTIGMTLVTAASGGQDISVGATIAIAGSVILKIIRGNQTDVSTMHAPLILAFLVAILAAMLVGAFNGALVSMFKVPPMVATLIMFTAGRPIAGWINDYANINIGDPVFRVFGGIIPGCPVPTAIIITAICMVIIALVLKFTTLGLYCQSVGINEKSARLNGINPKFVKFLAFVILGVCCAVSALIQTSRLGNINYSGICLNIEMDAILAVALGGNSLGGGKFSMKASILGAYIIQFLTVTLYRMDVKSEAISAYKAVVVIILVVISSPVVSNSIKAARSRREAKKVAGKVGVE